MKLVANNVGQVSSVRLIKVYQFGEENIKVPSNFTSIKDQIKDSIRIQVEVADQRANMRHAIFNFGDGVTQGNYQFRKTLTFFTKQIELLLFEEQPGLRPNVSFGELLARIDQRQLFKSVV